MTTVADLTQALQALFTTTADQVARRTGFVQRTSKLTGAAFVQALVCGWLANPQASVEGLAQAAAAVGVAISAQGLDQRFTEAAATFLEEMLTAAVQTVIATDPVAIPLLERFTAVVLLDSSTITLPAALALWWPGCSTGTAALKLHVRYDLCRGCLSGLVVQEGRISDRSTVMQTAPLPRANCASAAASVRPATSAASMSRPLLPMMSVATADSLMLAPSSVFCRRFTSALRSCKREVR